MLPDHLRVPGLNEPLSASEYAKLENLGEEDDVLEAIRFGRLHGVYFRGKWYLEAPPYSQERLSRLRGESKLEPGLLNWLRQRADLHENLQYKSEVKRLRAHRIKSHWLYDRLTPVQQEALLNTTKYAERPQPIDYGLSRYDVFCSHRGRYPLNDGLTYREDKSHEWRWLIFLWFVAYICIGIGILYLHASGQLKGTPAEVWTLVIVAAPASLMVFYFYLFPGLRDAYIRKRSRPGYSRYEHALRLHELYRTTAQAAAYEAEQAVLRQKRSYWECLNGYEFERATAEVLKGHQFNPRVTPGSADGGIDIEVTRAGLKGVVQCKAHVACVAPHTVRDLFGVIHHSRADFGVIVSRGGFTAGAVAFARDKPIFLIDASDLIAMAEGKDVLEAVFTRPKAT